MIPTPVDRCEGVLRRLERAWVFVAAAILFAIMVIVTVDVAMRYLFNSPLTWSYDAISLYLMAALFFGSLSDTFRHDRHVRVDIVATRLPLRLRRAVEVVTLSLAIVAFAVIFREGLHQALVSWVENDVLATTIPWPTWAYRVLVPLGVGLLIVRLALNIAVLAIAVVTGKNALGDVVERPPALTQADGAAGR